MAENLPSDTPKFWREQNLLRILTKRGRDAAPPRTRWSTLLSLCFLCPHLTVVSHVRIGRFCGGGISSFLTLAFNIFTPRKESSGYEEYDVRQNYKDGCIYKAILSLLFI